MPADCFVEKYSDISAYIGGPLPEVSRITAFIVGEDGKPSVECWAISSIVDSKQVQRADGSKATAHVLPLASRDLEGIDMLTWPSVSPIWPDPSGLVRSQGFDLAKYFRYLTSEFRSY